MIFDQHNVLEMQITMTAPHKAVSRTLIKHVRAGFDPLAHQIFKVFEVFRFDVVTKSFKRGDNPAQGFATRMGACPAFNSWCLIVKSGNPLSQLARKCLGQATRERHLV